MDVNTNIGMIATLITTLAGTVVAVAKSWSLINERIKLLEEGMKSTQSSADQYKIRVEKFIDEQQESQEHVLESVYQLTTAVRGIDGYNGLTGRVKSLDDRIGEVERMASANTARFDMWKEMQKDNREIRRDRHDDK